MTNLKFSHFALSRAIHDGLVEFHQPLTYRALQPYYNQWIWDHGCVKQGYTRPVLGSASFQQHIRLLRDFGMLKDEWHCILEPRAYRQMRLWRTWQEWPLEVPIYRRGDRWAIHWKEALYAVAMDSRNRGRKARPEILHPSGESG